jgi:hypothetical protein
VKFCLETDHTYVYKFCMKLFVCYDLITNMAAERFLDVMSDKGYVMEISTINSKKLYK